MSPQRQSANNGSCLPHGTQVRDNVRMKLGLNNTCAYCVSKMSLIYLAITETYCAWTNFDNFCTNVSERKQPIKRRFLISPCPAVLLCPRRNASTQNHVFLHFHSNAVLLHCQISRYAVLRPPFLVLSSAAFDHFDIKGWFSCIHKLLPGDILMCFMFYAGKQHLSEKTLFPVFPGSAETLDRLGVMIK